VERHLLGDCSSPTGYLAHHPIEEAMMANSSRVDLDRPDLE
jgi:hypothetical protein